MIVFKEGDGPFGGYQSIRIPALVKTPNGVLVAFAEGRWQPSDTGDINIICRRSTDGGITWGPMIEVLSHGNDTAGNPTAVIDPVTGDIVLLTCRNGKYDSWTTIAKGTAPARRVYVQRSVDDGQTWSTASEITAQVRQTNWRWYATGPGHGAVLSHLSSFPDRLVVACNHTRTPSGSDTGSESKYNGGHLIYSDDGGHTWKIGAVSSNPNGDVNESEATITDLGGNYLYANCRCEGDLQPGNRADAYSLDGGQTFHGDQGQPKAYRPQCALKTPIVQGSVISLSDITLIYSGPHGPQPERADMTLWISRNGGRSWSPARSVSGRPAAYSDLARIDADTIGLLYETGDWSPYDRIEFERVPIVDLL